MKYNEKDILNKIEKYIESTYKQHYASQEPKSWEENLQAMDIFRSLKIDQNFCQANAIKYLLRYGKKEGHNEQDLYKAIHYIILLISNK